MKISGMLILLTSLIGSISTAQESSLVPDAFLIRVEQSQVDLSPNGITSSDCMLVLPDGHFHLERRSQQLPTPQASLHIYESILSGGQLGQLRDLLNQSRIKTLPSFIQFGIPGPVFFRKSFQAEISRNNSVQSVGYAEWKTNEKGDNDEGNREILRQMQLQPKAELQPLLKWFVDIVTAEESVPYNTEHATFCK